MFLLIIQFCLSFSLFLSSSLVLSHKGLIIKAQSSRDNVGSTSEIELYIDYDSSPCFVALEKCYEATKLQSVYLPSHLVNLVKVRYSDVVIVVSTSEVVTCIANCLT